MRTRSKSGFSKPTKYGEIEAAGLFELGSAASKISGNDVLYVPRVFSYDSSSITMERLALEPVDGAALGSALAALHAVEPPPQCRFGYSMDGNIGLNAQINNVERISLDWATFFERYRLRPQIEGLHDGELREACERVAWCVRTNRVFDDLVLEDVVPRYLHGDLWNGNCGSVRRSRTIPCAFDPAFYFGHSEADLGIAHMFGMPNGFFTAYHAKNPQKPGFDKRAKVYELYHRMNHVRAFPGGGYEEGALALASSIM